MQLVRRQKRGNIDGGCPGNRLNNCGLGEICSGDEGRRQGGSKACLPGKLNALPSLK